MAGPSVPLGGGFGGNPSGAGPSNPPSGSLLRGYPNSHPHAIRPISVLPLLLANLHNDSLPFFLEPNHDHGLLKSASQNSLDSIIHTHY